MPAEIINEISEFLQKGRDKKTLKNLLKKHLSRDLTQKKF